MSIIKVMSLIDPNLQDCLCEIVNSFVNEHRRNPEPNEVLNILHADYPGVVGIHSDQVINTFIGNIWYPVIRNSGRASRED